MIDIKKRPNIFAGAGTAVVWILIAVFFSVFSVLPRRQEYKTVKITLESPPAPKIERQKEAAPPVRQSKSPAAQEAAPVPQPRPASSGSISAPRSSSQKTSPSASPSSAQAEPARQTLQKSVEELMAEQMSSRKTEKKEFDWSAFDDAETAVSSSAPSFPQRYSSASSVETFEGTAGTSSSQEDGGAVSSSSSGGRTVSQEVSGETAAALGDILATVYSANAGNGVTSSSSVKTASSPDGSLSLFMSDGSTRTLIEPKEPVISLSPAAASTIDTTKSLNVRFVVLANGHVDLNSITISPASIISPAVQSEIARAVSSWRFSEDSSSASATFPYRIEKR